MKINIFWGELTDISAKKEALDTTCPDGASHGACISVHDSPCVLQRSGNIEERLKKD